MVSIAELLPPIEKRLTSDTDLFPVSSTIFDRVRFNRGAPKVGGSGGASSRNPPPEQGSLFENTGPDLPGVTSRIASGNSGEVDAGKEYWKRVLDAICRRKPVKSTYEADMMGGQDSQGNTTTGFGGQVGGGSPPEV